jgi:DNA-binding MarR family transcriptional regulator
MSTGTSPGSSDGPPYVGALLRLCLEQVRARMREAVREAGFTDLQEAHWAILTHPAPDAVRPSDLARRARMSRQAANHLISQMEAMGYLERRGGGAGTRRLVHLTPRGWALCEAIFACLRGIEAEWAAEVGEERFAIVLDVLRHLAQPGLARPAR